GRRPQGARAGELPAGRPERRPEREPHEAVANHAGDAGKQADPPGPHAVPGHRRPVPPRCLPRCAGAGAAGPRRPAGVDAGSGEGGEVAPRPPPLPTPLPHHPEDSPMQPTRARSREAFERACRVIPGGVNSPARAFGAVGGQPPFIARGEGPYLFDLDGNRYLDYVGSWGPLILGHAHPRLVRAVEEAMHRGASFGAPTEAETHLAELIVTAMPSTEMVRLVSSGTEASMSAVRLARGFTGRDKIVKFAGCYHGHVDSLLVQAGSSATTL